MYLYDIRYVEDTGRIRPELKRLLPKDSSIKQWNGAVRYLTGQDKTFDSAIEAKEF